jgi:cardiolipin synthase A/B
LQRKEFIPGHTVRLIHGGESYFDALLELINESKHTLHLQVYIFELDETGNKILMALQEAVRRDVKVFLVVDGFGSLSLGSAFKTRMQEAGIAFRFFSKMPFPGIFQAGRRLHHKVCVADNRKSLVGGINIADKYRGSTIELPWLDFALLVEGNVSEEINDVCERIFSKKFTLKPVQRKPTLVLKEKEGIKIRMTRNDWIRRKNEISAAYKTMLGNANDEILLFASYFIPSRRLLKILIRASRRGRKVSIVLGRMSDVPFIKPATQYLYDKLLRNGIRIFEYKEAVLHAKACVVDREWVSIGSLNLNHLSELLSLELNLEVMDASFGASLHKEFHQLIQEHCVEVNIVDFEKERTMFLRFKSWFSYNGFAIFMRLLSFLNRKNPVD